MPKSEAWKEANNKYRATKTKQVVIQLRAQDKAQWDAYAQSQGKPLATLIRGLMAADMAAHGWIMDNQKPEDV